MPQKGTSDYRTEVVRFIPWRRYATWGVSASLVVILVLLAYYAGGLSSRAWRESLQQTNIEQRKKIDKLQTELASVRRRLTSHELSVELGRRSSEELRQALVDIEKTNADLNEQIAFYKGLMDPTMNGEISFRGVEVEPSGVDNEFDLSIVVQQLSLNHRLVSGSLTWRLLGIQLDENGNNSERELNATHFASGGKIKLRFKYFQNISDRVVLPAGFTPKVLHVKVSTSGKNAVEADEEYAWSSLIE